MNAIQNLPLHGIAKRFLLPTLSLVALPASQLQAAQSDHVIIHEEQSLSTPGLAVSDHFGFDVGVSGDWMVVGAKNLTLPGGNQEGAAFVFERTAGLWVEEVMLIAHDANMLQSDNFGTSVAISGDTIVVGAPNSVDLLAPGRGAVHVWRNLGTGWTLEDTILAPDAFSGDFGWSVDIDDDLLVVGDVNDNEFFTQGGAAVVFQRAGTDWIFIDKLVGSSIIAGEQFGTSVAVDGDTIVVGSPRIGGAGSVYVFEKFGALIIETDHLIPTDSTTNDRFGMDVGISGDHLITGAHNKFFPTQISAGSAYIYERVGTNFVEQDKLLAAQPGTGDQFGFSVAIEGDLACVGANRESNGRAYMFTLRGGNWVGAGRFSAIDTQFLNQFARSVAIDGETIAVGASHTNSFRGSAHAFVVRETFYDDFCIADESIPGCGICPCAGNLQPGEFGGCVNEASTSAYLGAFGDASAANDTLRFELTRAVPSVLAVLVSADNQLPIAGACPVGVGIQSAILSGLRCVGGNLKRHGGRSTDSFGQCGLSSPAWGGSSAPPNGIMVQGGFSSGQTRYFQVFYRELVWGTCTEGINTSNAVIVAFMP